MTGLGTLAERAAIVGVRGTILHDRDEGASLWFLAEFLLAHIGLLIAVSSGLGSALRERAIRIHPDETVAPARKRG